MATELAASHRPTSRARYNLPVSGTGDAFTIVFFNNGAPFHDGHKLSKLDTPTWVAVDERGQPVATLATELHENPKSSTVLFDRCVTTFALASKQSDATVGVVRAAQNWWMQSHQLTLYRTGTASEKGARLLDDLGIDIAPFCLHKYERWRAVEDQNEALHLQQPDGPREFNGPNPFGTLTVDESKELRKQWFDEAEALLKANPTGYP